MERRSFLRLLLGTAAVVPAAAAAAKYDLVRVVSNTEKFPKLPYGLKELPKEGDGLQSLAQDLPELPVPRHDPVGIAKRLQIALGHLGGNTHRGDNFQELMGMGRGFCKSWELTENGLLVNKDLIQFSARLAGAASHFMLIDPDNPQFCSAGPLSIKRALMPGDSGAFYPNSLVFSPDMLELKDTYLRETAQHPSNKFTRPYVCAYCPARYGDYDALRTHLWHTHGKDVQGNDLPRNVHDLPRDDPKFRRSGYSWYESIFSPPTEKENT